MNEASRLLSDLKRGDPHAAEGLLPLIYDELRKLAARKMAQEAPGQTLQATALVHEGDRPKSQVLNLTLLASSRLSLLCGQRFVRGLDRAQLGLEQAPEVVAGQR
jgi:ECF sigma factor